MIDKTYRMYSLVMNLLHRTHIDSLPGVRGGVYRLFSTLQTLMIKTAGYIEKDSALGVTEKKRETQIIVSLTSFPQRIEDVPVVIKTIMMQSVKADRIMLWLANDEFPNGIEDLPETLRGLQQLGLEIYFCENLKSHKKYYFTMKNHPNSVVITVDDDVFYPSTLIEELLRLEKTHEGCIVCTRGHMMTTSPDGQIQGYGSWVSNPPTKESPEMMICPTGVGGVLYPPHSLSENVFNDKEIKAWCLNADDLWLRVMGLLNATKVVKSNQFRYSFLAVGKTQNFKLSKENVIGNNNDRQLSMIMEKYGQPINTVLKDSCFADNM